MNWRDKFERAWNNIYYGVGIIAGTLISIFIGWDYIFLVGLFYLTLGISQSRRI